ncbi:ABC transporter permease [Thermococcus celer]|uniref:ABC transporter n=1 Tax=Thermococcus celer Vu 13 = JCM 8558 TaxID=1293037 RepID=A0A218P036_THECE|nr:iron ABC transporter permease [Thermococcus celer]ASI98291.1 ABC transporter [Thermococcus celer] [Thermococcus celer Vu 13 = JCM 8558]
MGSRLPKLLLLIPLAFLVVFFYVPLVSILKTGLWENGFTLGHVTSVLSNDYHRRVILFTIGQAIASTLLTLALGLPGAYIFAKYNFPGKDTVKAILTVPFVVPSVMVALGFILLFGKSGLVTGLLGRDPGILYSWKGILLAHAFYNFPIVVRMVSALWERINPHYEEAAMALGARGWRLFWRVTLPMISPAIFASAMLTFVFCFLSFSIPLIIGGYRYATMEVDIFTSIMVLLDFRTGAAMAIIQIALSMAFMYLYLKALDAYARREEQRILRKPVRFTRGDWLSLKGLFVAVYTLIVFVFIVSPLLAVLYDSLRFNDSWSLENYRRLFSSGYNPMFGATTLDVIRNSLTFGLATVFLSVLVALPVAYALHRWNFRGRRLFDVLVMLPLASSPVTLGLGYIRVFHTTRLYYTVWIVIAAHTVIAYPFVLRAVSTSLKKIRPNLWEAALSLGAREWRAFLRVELPLAVGGVIVGAIFAFAISIAELGATYMLARPEYTTMTVAVYKFLGARQFGPASALAVLLMVLSTLSFLIIEKAGEEVW